MVINSLIVIKRYQLVTIPYEYTLKKLGEKLIKKLYEIIILNKMLYLYFDIQMVFLQKPSIERKIMFGMSCFV